MAEQWGEVIQFIDGNGYGVASDGKTIWLGKEADVQDMLSNPNKRSNNDLINGIIDLERELREEKYGRTTDIRKASTERRSNSIKRGGLVRGAKRQGGYTRKAQKGKRFSIR